MYKRRYRIMLMQDSIITHYTNGCALEWHKSKRLIRMTNNDGLIGDKDLSNSIFSRTHYFMLVDTIFNLIKDGKFD